MRILATTNRNNYFNHFSSPNSNNLKHSLKL
ncbi:hypothetical protein [Acinetobacter phage Ab69]|nr:hypothetical protein [Acinetobacter phage Ab69]